MSDQTPLSWLLDDIPLIGKSVYHPAKYEGTFVLKSIVIDLEDVWYVGDDGIMYSAVGSIKEVKTSGD